LEATDHAIQPAGFKVNDVAPNIGRGYPFWLGAGFGRTFVLQGIHGQFIQVVPAIGVVVVQTGVWANPVDQAALAERAALVRAITTAFATPAAK